MKRLLLAKALTAITEPSLADNVQHYQKRHGKRHEDRRDDRGDDRRDDRSDDRNNRHGIDRGHGHNR